MPASNPLLAAFGNGTPQSRSSTPNDSMRFSERKESPADPVPFPPHTVPRTESPRPLSRDDLFYKPDSSAPGQPNTFALGSSQITMPASVLPGSRPITKAQPDRKLTGSPELSVLQRFAPAPSNSATDAPTVQKESALQARLRESSTHLRESGLRQRLMSRSQSDLSERISDRNGPAASSPANRTENAKAPASEPKTSAAKPVDLFERLKQMLPLTPTKPDAAANSTPLSERIADRINSPAQPPPTPVVPPNDSTSSLEARIAGNAITQSVTSSMSNTSVPDVQSQQPSSVAIPSSPPRASASSVNKPKPLAKPITMNDVTALFVQGEANPAKTSSSVKSPVLVSSAPPSKPVQKEVNTHSTSQANRPPVPLPFPQHSFINFPPKITRGPFHDTTSSSVQSSGLQGSVESKSAALGTTTEAAAIRMSQRIPPVPASSSAHPALAPLSTLESRSESRREAVVPGKQVNNPHDSGDANVQKQPKQLQTSQPPTLAGPSASATVKDPLQNGSSASKDDTRMKTRSMGPSSPKPSRDDARPPIQSGSSQVDEEEWRILAQCMPPNTAYARLGHIAHLHFSQGKKPEVYEPFLKYSETSEGATLIVGGMPMVVTSERDGWTPTSPTSYWKEELARRALSGDFFGILGRKKCPKASIKPYWDKLSHNYRKMSTLAPNPKPTSPPTKQNARKPVSIAGRAGATTASTATDVDMDPADPFSALFGKLTPSQFRTVPTAKQPQQQASQAPPKSDRAPVSATMAISTSSSSEEGQMRDQEQRPRRSAALRDTLREEESVSMSRRSSSEDGRRRSRRDEPSTGRRSSRQDVDEYDPRTRGRPVTRSSRSPEPTRPTASRRSTQDDDNNMSSERRAGRIRSRSRDRRRERDRDRDGERDRDRARSPRAERRRGSSLDARNRDSGHKERTDRSRRSSVSPPPRSARLRDDEHERRKDEEFLRRLDAFNRSSPALSTSNTSTGDKRKSIYPNTTYIRSNIPVNPVDNKRRRSEEPAQTTSEVVEKRRRTSSPVAVQELSILTNDSSLATVTTTDAIQRIIEDTVATEAQVVGMAAVARDGSAPAEADAGAVSDSASEAMSLDSEPPNAPFDTAVPRTLEDATEAVTLTPVSSSHTEAVILAASQLSGAATANAVADTAFIPAANSINAQMIPKPTTAMLRRVDVSVSTEESESRHVARTESRPATHVTDSLESRLSYQLIQICRRAIRLLPFSCWACFSK